MIDLDKLGRHLLPLTGGQDPFFVILTVIIYPSLYHVACIAP